MCHCSLTARERDKLRQLVLVDLGCKLHRIWSTDWWHDAKGEMEKVLAVIAYLHREWETEQKQIGLAWLTATVLPELMPSPLADPQPPVTNRNPATSVALKVDQVADFSGFHAIIYPDRIYDYDTTTP